MIVSVFHGTSSEFTGTPTPQTDINGLTGIFFTESEADAQYFAEANTEGSDDGEARVFSGSIDLTDAEDLSEMDAEQDQIIEAAYNSNAAIIILPDLSGVSDREILVKRASLVTWN